MCPTWELPKIRGGLLRGPCNKGTIFGSRIFGNSHITPRKNSPSYKLHIVRQKNVQVSLDMARDGFAGSCATAELENDKKLNNSSRAGDISVLALTRRKSATLSGSRV